VDSEGAVFLSFFGLIGDGDSRNLGTGVTCSDAIKRPIQKGFFWKRNMVFWVLRARLCGGLKILAVMRKRDL